MRHPQIIVYEGDGRLARLLFPLAEERRWALRQPRRPEACARLLRHGSPTVLVLVVGGKPAAELALLERLTWQAPDLAAVVVGRDVDPALAGLAWDLGAAYVAAGPQLPGQLTDVVAGLMDGAAARHRAALGKAPVATARIEPEPPGPT
jgi:DNA-binding NarL/FixJ family response regulator